MKKDYNCFISNIKIVIRIIKTIIIRVYRDLDIISFVANIVYKQIKIKNAVDLIECFIKTYKITYSLLNIVYSSILGKFLNSIKNIYKMEYIQ